MAGQLCEIVILQINRAFRGPNTGYPALLDTLRDVTAAHARWTPAEDRHSIWQIVQHLIDSKTWSAERLQGKRPPVPPWVEASGDQAAWQDTLRRLEQTHEDYLQLLREKSDEELLQAIPGLGPLVTIILANNAEHVAYHAGQIRYLAAMQGIPFPGLRA